MNKRTLILIIALVIVSVIFSETTVLAQPVGSTDISGLVGESLYLSPPSSCAFDFLRPNNDEVLGPKTVKVTSNSAHWSLTIQANNSGYMMNTNSHPLVNPLQVMGGDISSYTSLTSIVTLKNKTGIVGTDVPVNDIYFQQRVDPDEQAGAYSIRVTFTVTSGTP